MKTFEQFVHENMEPDPKKEPGDYIEFLDMNVSKQDFDTFQKIIDDAADAMRAGEDDSIKDIFDKMSDRNPKMYQSFLNRFHDLSYDK